MVNSSYTYLGLKLNDMSQKGLRDEMTAEIPDEVVHHFLAVGTHDQIAAAIDAHFGGMVDVISLPADTPSDLVQDICALKSPFSKGVAK